MNQRIQLASLDDQRNAEARETVRQRISWPANLTPANVTYHSRGHALLLGSERDTRQAARILQGRGLASLTLVFTAPNAANVDDGVNDSDLLAATEILTTQALTRAQAEKLRISGHLGMFKTLLDGDEPLDLARALIEREAFDLVLDLNASPCLSVELPPPGYVVMQWQNVEQRNDILDDFVGLVGEFDKPRYFQVNSDLCAHSTSGNIGCTRCLDVCPADAISSIQGRIESHIEIDPFLCQGVGSCTSACPTGAIEFRLPETRRQQDTLSAWLGAYREAGGQAPVLRFITHDSQDAERAAGVVTAGHIIDAPLEELGAAGHDQWLTALAAGAAEVRIQLHPNMPARLSAFLTDQLTQAHALLDALGHDRARVKLIEIADYADRDALPALTPLTESPLSLPEPEKRARFNRVLARLAELGNSNGERAAMPAGAAYGAIQVDSDACTLCHACVSNCPTPALKSGGKTPALSFLEADCVQCGLCEQACPENAITLMPGFLASNARETRHICHEEAAFECINCGKPFATVSTVATIKQKLANHPYFAGEAMIRLEMCEDCRVKDVWKTMIRDPDAQLKV
ncbi:4Fe-4S ferredoxin [Halomonas sp. Choline-3u-9]|uniref:4Fe-4S dicluster domain-containing protein n=1 Tax=unclassified Halomonas TaxID=2609666 RepID=UPI0004866D92|nr:MULTISPECIES: 4Fe-4S dicluster domain-containing protein [unclassified Halomonas]NAO94497.1 4Fe-4S dicluster domain-containing protein [Halomonas sp. MG34]PKH61894.1 4Fe-4S ferredoxin [Halomonas sp. Choline-3u-9]